MGVTTNNDPTIEWAPTNEQQLRPMGGVGCEVKYFIQIGPTKCQVDLESSCLHRPGSKLFANVISRHPQKRCINFRPNWHKVKHRQEY